eukprot:TRINITY_DN345_c0_g1_i3.p1 TRINITY_DN345_c0_g1~~TRINITY_DN345_c0_g1_i3.p1  ORF type:complete len:107 (+),score=34.77 TRINITY_DN345_c0_g1_i3:121-441(+)
MRGPFTGSDQTRLLGRQPSRRQEPVSPLQALEDFKQGRANILVATDVAARGIDIKDIKFVINYEFPLVVEDYVHRIGRTGRAGSKGAAHTFFSVENKGFAFDLARF